MRCSVCAHELEGAVYTFAALTLSGRALCANTCRLCASDLLGKPVIRKIDQLLDRSGCDQPPLPGLVVE